MSAVSVSIPEAIHHRLPHVNDSVVSVSAPNKKHDTSLKKLTRSVAVPGISREVLVKK